MRPLLFLFSTLFLFPRCQQDDIPVNGTGIINQQFEITLHEKVVLQGSTGQKEGRQLGQIEFSHLDESRCPANAMCIRQGAAIATFRLSTDNTAEKQTVRLFIGDFMPDDPRKKRHLTADTVSVQLANHVTYRLILKKVTPYPGTSIDSTEKPKATLLLEKQ